MMKKISINKKIYASILEYAKKELPNEACGLIAGNEVGDIRTIEKVYMLTNIDKSSEHFSLSTQEQLEAVKDIRANGLKLLGNWHSHPSSPSRPSDEDIRLAFDKNLSYLILSLINQNEHVLNSFHIENGTSVREEIIFTGE